MSIKLKNAYHLALAIGALIYYRFPSQKLKVIGVTGTDGKTTTVTLIYHILKAAKKKVSMISTVEAVLGSKNIATGLHTTTPDPFITQRLLRQMVDRGDEYAILEVSSHGIHQFRVFGINFLVGVLTNITPEHLDYHGTFTDYLATKASFLKSAKTSVLNTEDNSYTAVRNLISSMHKVLTYPILNPTQKLKRAINKFPEPYNRLNAQAAIMAAQAVGIPEAAIIDGLTSFSGVEGRMEEVKNSLGIKIIVDFAHTPNALKNVLTVLKKKAQHRLICVCGSAGERDHDKRPLMGRTASGIADVAIFTAEDPRNENITDILDSMAKGAIKGKKIFKIPERGEAIRYAINDLAKKGDLVVICGKGHEKSMSYSGVEYPWSEILAVKTALKNKALVIER